MIIKETNKYLEEPLTIREFLCWIGIWLFLSTASVFWTQDFWLSRPINRNEGAPYRINDWMARHRFDKILAALNFTDEEPPDYRDKFWEIRQLLREWNNHMHETFIPSWVSCLDESMSICLIDGLAQDGYFVPISHIHLVTSTTQLLVGFPGYCMLLNFGREKIIQEN